MLSFFFRFNNNTKKKEEYRLLHSKSEADQDPPKLQSKPAPLYGVRAFASADFGSKLFGRFQICQLLANALSILSIFQLQRKTIIKFPPNFFGTFLQEKTQDFNIQRITLYTNSTPQITVSHFVLLLTLKKSLLAYSFAAH